MSRRQIFSESEKFCLQELIIKYKLNSASTIAAGNTAAKKQAWASLLEEYNSIESNCKRSEAQLRKCWDNLKTRKKAVLAKKKKECMRTGRGSFQPKSEPSEDDPLLVDEALVEQTEVELLYVTDNDNIPADTSQGTRKNVRAKVINEEFKLRKNRYTRLQEREEELHRLSVQEKQWLVKAAQEIYKKAVIERRNAEEILQSNINKHKDLKE